MAFSDDYESFRAAVPRFIDWTGYTTTHVDDLIAVSERKVYKALRTRANEFRFSINAGSGGTVAVPDDYEEMKSARMSAAPARKLVRKSVEEIYSRFGDRSVTGNQLWFAREGDVFIFGPAGAAGDTMQGVYYRSGTSMAQSATINSIFAAHPDIFLMAAASESSAYIGMDSRIAVWEQKFQQLIAIANQAARDEDTSGSILVGSLG